MTYTVADAQRDAERKQDGLKAEIEQLTGKLRNCTSQLVRAENELGAALGAALVMAEDRQAGLEQLNALLAQAEETAQEQVCDLPPHWRLVQNLLALKTKSLGGNR